MNDHRASDRDLDRAIRSWLREDRHEDVARVAGAVLDLVETTPQRRFTWWPARRTETMNKIVGFAGAAAAVAVAAVVGAGLLGSGQSGPGAAPASSPPATPEPSTAPSATAEPSASPATSAPPLTQTFTSPQHGITVSYPEGWTAQAATEPWTESTFPLAFGAPHADWLSDPTLEGNLFLTIASQPIGDATPEAWAAAKMLSDEGCPATTPLTVDGASGLSGLTGAEDCNIAVVTTAGRGYWIQLYTSEDDPLAVAPYDRAWFEGFLATVQLHPEDAVDAGP